MFKLLSLNQLLAQPFYHKTEGCEFGFQRAISKHLIFSELAPRTPYHRRRMIISLEELFNSQDMEIKYNGSITPVYTYFEKQYSDIESKLGSLKTAADVRELLASIDPFLSPLDILTDIDNIKLAKIELLGLLEDDQQELARLRKGKPAPDVAESRDEDVFPSRQLDSLKPALIELESKSSKSQGGFASMLENVYSRNEKGIKRELANNLLPFLELLTVDYINSRIFILASDMEIEPPQAGCRMEITTKGSLTAGVGEIFSRPAVAVAKLHTSGSQGVLALLGINCKVDSQSILVKIRVDFGRKGEGVIRHLHMQKSLNKFFTGPELYAEIYYGLAEFLGKRSCLLEGSNDIQDELKSKAEALLQAADICQEYAKLLPTLDKVQIRYILTYLMHKKTAKINELILATFKHYLKSVKDSEGFQMALNYFKGLKSCIDSAGITLKDSDWGALIPDIEALRKSSAIDAGLLLLLLKSLFEGSPFLETYRKLCGMEDTGITYGDEYNSICINIFDYHNWQEQSGNYTAFKPEFKTTVINFMLHEVLAKLEKPGGTESLQEINRVLGSLDLKPAESDLKPLVTGIRSLSLKDGQTAGSAENIAGYFKALELFFTGLSCLETYSQFFQICLAGEKFLNGDYVGIGLNIFDHDNWLKDKNELNQDLKAAMKKFAVRQMISLLPEARNRQKINQNRAVLDKLGIPLSVPEDVQPLLAAVGNSPLKDNAKQQIKNGQGVQEYFDILADFLGSTKQFGYYQAFAEVKLGQYNFSDFHYVDTALKILDCRNWGDDSINENIRQEIKQFYFSTFLNPKLGREDKIANLNTLHSRLKISITSGERDELGKHLKHRIEGLVDLLNAMEEMTSTATKM